MATFSDPERVDGAPAVLVYSDAAANDEAIRDIDSWAREHGFVRTPLNWLQTVRRNGRVLFYCPCFRLPEGHDEAVQADMKRIRERRDRMPRTADSHLLLRESD